MASSREGPDFVLEHRLYGSGAACVCGVDEAGRGPLAGPVVVAAVVLKPAMWPEGLDDSKRLGAADRERLFDAILAGASVAIATAGPAAIDRRNIRGATLDAMARAVAALVAEGVAPDHALIDGRDVPPGLGCAATAVIGGDARSLSIAAASIVAKVTRDRMMTRLDALHPGYGFAVHKGYGTPAHLAALRQLGPCPAHRMSFAPVAAARRG